MEDTEADGGTPTPVSSAATSPSPVNVEELEIALYELITNEKWSASISFIKHNRGQFVRDHDEGFETEDDIVHILNIYCKKLIQERSGLYSF